MQYLRLLPHHRNLRGGANYDRKEARDLLLSTSACGTFRFSSKHLKSVLLGHLIMWACVKMIVTVDIALYIGVLTN